VSHPISYISSEPNRPPDPSRPVIWLKIIGPQASIQVEALADTGSTATYLDWSLADVLGATFVVDPKRVKWRGIAYERASTIVQLEISDDRHQILRWHARVWFWTAQPGFALFGQRDGLLLFDATFRPGLQRLELEPTSEYLHHVVDVAVD
jgi:hypothetical protein